MMSDRQSERLFSRLIDGEATAAEWDELLGAGNAGQWRQLAETLRDHTSLARAVNASVVVADTIEPPLSPTGTGGRWTRRPSGWSGWAVAAAVALAWVIGVSSKRQPPPVAAPPQLAASMPAAELLAAYLEKGRQEDSVIGEVPQRILIDSRPAPSGEGHELLYLRQILERAIVPDLYRPTGQDELGRPTLVPFDQSRGPSM